MRSRRSWRTSVPGRAAAAVLSSGRSERARLEAELGGAEQRAGRTGPQPCGRRLRLSRAAEAEAEPSERLPPPSAFPRPGDVPCTSPSAASAAVAAESLESLEEQVAAAERKARPRSSGERRRSPRRSADRPRIAGGGQPCSARRASTASWNGRPPPVRRSSWRALPSRRARSVIRQANELGLGRSRRAAPGRVERGGGRRARRAALRLPEHVAERRVAGPRAIGSSRSRSRRCRRFSVTRTRATLRCRRSAQ